MSLRITEPGTGLLIAELPETELATLPASVSAAKKAQISWAATPLKARIKILLKMRELLIRDSDSIAASLSRENGKPEFEALSNEVLPSIQMLTHTCSIARKELRDRSIPLSFLIYKKSVIQKFPIGVVAVISPWNYPLLLPLGTIATALVAGNSVLFKPSEVTPLIGLTLQKIADEAGLPKGVLTTLVGGGALGAALIAQKPGKVFFTGSVETGKKVMRQCAELLTPVNLELGGKDPLIIFEDANLDHAASAALWGGFSNSGQMCSSVERILVHESVKERFVSALEQKLGKLTYTQNLKQTDLGFTTYKAQKEIYREHLGQLKNSGLTLLTGFSDLHAGEFRAGDRAVIPTIVVPSLTAGTENFKIYQEESFGPFVAVTTFKTDSEAIQKANDSPYGLCASVFTQNLNRAKTVARQIEAGTVLINETPYTAGLAEAPWGGIKDSGIGRTHGRVGLSEVVHLRHVQWNRSRLFQFASPWWFPYTPHQKEVFRAAVRLYSQSLAIKLSALMKVTIELVQMLKKEPRI